MRNGAFRKIRRTPREDARTLMLAVVFRLHCSRRGRYGQKRDSKRLRTSHYQIPVMGISRQPEGRLE